MIPVALITGAGRGIGRSAAIELSRRGYQPILVSRSLPELEETAHLCGRGEVMPADVADPDQVARVVEQAFASLGRVDALVHCAGIALMRAIDQLSVDEWRRMIDTNLSAVIFFCRELWPRWRKQGGGVVVNISSFSARDPFAGLGPYGAAKAGVNLLGLALDREGQPINVRVHTIAPAATETAMLRGLIGKTEFPTEKTLSPNDVARVIAQCVCGDLVHTSGEVIYLHQSQSK